MPWHIFTLPRRTQPGGLWTTRDLSRHLQVSQPMIYRWIASGRLAATRLDGRWRISPEALEAFLASSTRALP